MKLFFMVLIAAVVYVVSVMRKLSSTETSDNKLPRGIMGDDFPTIEPMEEDEPFVMEQPQPKNNKKAVQELFTNMSASAAKKATATTSATVAEPFDDAPIAKKEHFAIKTKSDAKKAIIYSEIFNRKYN